MFQPITLTAATTLDRNRHKDTLLILDNGTGFTTTLPASTGKGDTYRFYVKTTVTSGAMVVAALTTDIIQGAVGLASDVAGVTCPTTATSDYITMNGSTTGGVLGSYFELRDVLSGTWMITGTLVSSGSEATPFAAT